MEVQSNNIYLLRKAMRMCEFKSLPVLNRLVDRKIDLVLVTIYCFTSRSRIGLWAKSLPALRRTKNRLVARKIDLVAYVPIKNWSLSREDLYRTTRAVTLGLGFSGLIWRTTPFSRWRIGLWAERDLYRTTRDTGPLFFRSHPMDRSLRRPPYLIASYDSEGNA
jgi:hypothetical protein